MNRQQALETFLAKCPAEDADWQAVGELIDDDPELDAQVRDAADDIISDAVCDVEVPAELRGKLRASLGLDDAVVSATASPTKTTRRKWFAWAGSGALVAAAVTLAVLLWPEQTEPPKLPAYTAVRADILSTSWESLPEFTGDFDSDKQAVVRSWRLSPLKFDPQVKGFAAKSKQIAAVYRFQLPIRNGNRATGYLMAIPRSELGELPDADQFSTRDPVYLTTPKGFVSVAWKDDRFAYVCAIEQLPGGGDSLETLQTVLIGQPA